MHSGVKRAGGQVDLVLHHSLAAAIRQVALFNERQADKLRWPPLEGLFEALL